MNQLDLCRFIADVAHAAKGQTRADGITAYISHPARVVDLVREWDGRHSSDERLAAQCAAWLHDVVEDTSITLSMLEMWGVEDRTIHLVDLLTKKNAPQEPEDPEYYRGIASDETALLIKAADRCDNLTDALAEVKRTGKCKRWKGYVERTKTDMLPLYAELPELRRELETRLKAVEDAILEARGADPNGVFDCGVAVK